MNPSQTSLFADFFWTLRTPYLECKSQLDRNREAIIARIPRMKDVAVNFDDMPLIELDISKPSLRSPSAERRASIIDKDFLASVIHSVKNSPALFSTNFDNVVALYAKKQAENQQVINNLSSKYTTSVHRFSESISDLEITLKDFSDELKKCKSNGSLNNALSALDESLVSKIETSISNADKLSLEADQSLKNLMSCSKSYDVTSFTISEVHENHLTTLGSFILLLIQYLKDINDSNLVSLKNQGELTKLSNEERLAEYQAKAAEVEKKNAAAKKINKILSFFSKIFGTLLAILGVVAAIPTGGASTIPAIVGFSVATAAAALVIVDTILTFTTDFSPIDYVFKKITDGVNYLVEHSLTMLVERIAMQCGVDKDSEKMKDIRKYFTMVTSNVLVLALIVTPAIIAGAGSTAAAKQATQEAFSTSVSEMTTTTLQKVTQGAIESTSQSLSALSTIKNSALYASGITAILDGLATAGLEITSGIYTKNFYDSLGALRLNELEINVLSQLRDEQNKNLKSLSEVHENLNESICAILQDRYESLKTGYHNLARLGTI